MKKITPNLWYNKEAKEATQFYVSIFPNSKITSIQTITNTPSGDCDIVSFTLNGQPFMAISAGPIFKLSEAVSFIITCENQKEIDYYWEKLSAVPESEQCGWCKDKFGLSRQVVPAAMEKLMKTTDKAKLDRITQAFLKMKKLDIKMLEYAAKGK